MSPLTFAKQLIDTLCRPAGVGTISPLPGDAR